MIRSVIDLYINSDDARDNFRIHPGFFKIPYVYRKQFMKSWIRGLNEFVDIMDFFEKNGKYDQWCADMIKETKAAKKKQKVKTK